MVFQTSDRATSPTGAPKSDASSSLMADVNSDLMKGMPKRPSAPHYVGQAEFDAGKGLKDLNSGKFDQGEKSLHQSINDLDKEGKLIGNAQSGGKDAAGNILKGNDKAAEQDLTKSIAGMKDNGFTSAARKDDEAALKQLDEGHKWAAEKDIDSGEQVLDNRDKRVDTSKTDIQNGLKDFNSGKFDQGEKDVRQGMQALDQKHVTKDPPPPGGGSKGGSGGDGGTSSDASASSQSLVHNGVMEIPSAAHLYT